MLENIKLVGTSHISKDSEKKIAKVLEEFKPEIVAVELDKKRFVSLMNTDPNMKQSLSINDLFRVGVMGFLFMLIGRWAQKKLGSIVGVTPGTDMKRAIELAREKKLKIALVDRDIEFTLRRFSKEFTFKEKMRLIWEIISAPFSKKKKVAFDISKIPKQEVIVKLIDQIKDKYPSIYRVLIEERNKYMAKRVFAISQTKKVACVIGAGHEKGMQEELKNLYYNNISRA